MQVVFSKLHILNRTPCFNRQICLISSSLLVIIIPFLWRFHSSKKPLSEEPSTLQAKAKMELENSSCEICTYPKRISELFSIEGCSHSYCKLCLSQYISSKLENNELLIKCPCPDCITGKLEPGGCSSILEDGVFDRWCVALCESSVENKFYCPFKDCSALMINDGDSLMREAECLHCNRLFCSHCMVPWHSGLSCNEFQAESSSIQISEDLMLINLAKNSLWKRCPNCNFFVEKTSGCMFVKCRCGLTFCYGCGTEMKLDHYCSVCKR